MIDPEIAGEPWMAWGTPEHRAMFGCKVCGEICDVSPGEGLAVCPAHCEDHDYEYEPGDGHRCKHCFAERPADWGDE
jgi:hypothetical protein